MATGVFMLYLFFILLSISSFADTQPNIHVVNNSQYKIKLAYSDKYKMCSPDPATDIAPKETKILTVCFPSSFWDPGLESEENIEYHIGSNRDRFLIKGFVENKQTDSSAAVSKVISVQLIKGDSRIETLPYIDENPLKIWPDQTQDFNIEITDNDLIDIQEDEEDLHPT